MLKKNIELFQVYCNTHHKKRQKILEKFMRCFEFSEGVNCTQHLSIPSVKFNACLWKQIFKLLQFILNTNKKNHWFPHSFKTTSAIAMASLIYRQKGQSKETNRDATFGQTILFGPLFFHRYKLQNVQIINCN